MDTGIWEGSKDSGPARVAVMSWVIQVCLRCCGMGFETGIGRRDTMLWLWFFFLPFSSPMGTFSSLVQWQHVWIAAGHLHSYSKAFISSLYDICWFTFWYAGWNSEPPGFWVITCLLLTCLSQKCSIRVLHTVSLNCPPLLFLCCYPCFRRPPVTAGFCFFDDSIFWTLS